MNYYNEIDPYCARWLNTLMIEGLIPFGDIDTRSIEDVIPNELSGYNQCHFFAGLGGWPLALSLAGWPSSRPVWTGSCPCQPFSAAGKGAGFGDRRHLWPSWFHLIQQCLPPVIFGEQVEGPAARMWLDLVHSDLEKIKYAFAAGVLPAASVGAPQLRHRTWFVADTYYSRRQRAIRQGKQRTQGPQRKSACSEFMRSNSGSWPPGPRAVDLIPMCTNGIPAAMGGCKAYGNAIVPQVAAAFIKAYCNVA